MAFLKAEDIVDLAMQLEQTGEAFYRAVAGKATSGSVRSLFGDLADQEVKHYQIFARLGERLAEAPLMTDGEWNEYVSYLDATVQSAFFQGPDKALALAEGVTDEREALRMAIGFEKETLLFFYDLRDTVQVAEQSFVQAIIDQEKAHIRRLSEML